MDIGFSFTSNAMLCPFGDQVGCAASLPNLSLTTVFVPVAGSNTFRQVVGPLPGRSTTPKYAIRPVTGSQSGSYTSRAGIGKSAIIGSPVAFMIRNTDHPQRICVPSGDHVSLHVGFSAIGIRRTSAPLAAMTYTE